jgi:hypothetical protein
LLGLKKFQKLRVIGSLLDQLGDGSVRGQRLLDNLKKKFSYIEIFR